MTDVAVLLACTDTEQAQRAAQIMQARAGHPFEVFLFEDKKRQGFVKSVNQLFQGCGHRYVVYAAQDAYPGMHWLRIAFEVMEKSGKSLLAFNDGKWFGRLAAFGMVRSTWVRSHYGSSLLWPEYESHYADNELTQIAQRSNELVYSPHAMLIEVDFAKGARWTSNADDKALFQKRQALGFPTEQAKAKHSESASCSNVDPGYLLKR